MFTVPGDAVADTTQEDLMIETFEGIDFGGVCGQLADGVVEFDFAAVFMLFGDKIDQRLTDVERIIDHGIERLGMMDVGHVGTFPGSFVKAGRIGVVVAFGKMFGGSKKNRNFAMSLDIKDRKITNV